MSPDLARHFTVSDGRVWRVSEFFAPHLARAITAAESDPSSPVPLLFVSGADRRWIDSAPGNWVDVRIDVLVELLNRTRPMPILAWSMGGLSDG